MEQVLADRLGLTTGDTLRLGTQDFRLSALLTREPDSAGAGFGLGPRTIVRTQALDNSGLLETGTLFNTKYRLTLPPTAELEALEQAAEKKFGDAGMRWRDSRNGAPGWRGLSNGWARSWCWSACPVWPWVGLGCRLRCGPIWPRKPA